MVQIYTYIFKCARPILGTKWSPLLVSDACWSFVCFNCVCVIVALDADILTHFLSKYPKNIFKKVSHYPKIVRPKFPKS